MVDLIELTNAQVDTFRAIPELVAALADGDPANVIAYYDINPDMNDWVLAQYQSPAGSVLVGWEQSARNSAENMEMWVHSFSYFVRGQPGQSAFTIINLLIKGVPDPGDGQRWYMCEFLPGTLPGQVQLIERVTDEERVDLYVIRCDISETGDL